MADKEAYDYLPTKTADYTTTTLSVKCQVEIDETPKKNQVDHEFYDGGITTVNLSENMWFDGTLQWPQGISKSDAGTILDFYTDSAKADMKRRSIYWEHPVDGHTYVIKFRGDLTRKWIAKMPDFLPIPQIPIRIIGRKLIPVDVPQSEVDALIALYYATGGDDWTENTNWLDNTVVDNWFGVTVSGGHVTEIDLNDNNLIGAVDDTLDPLATYLTSLKLHTNTISVLDVSALTSLETLYCRDNTITTLDVSALTSLETLDCHANTISTLDVSALTSLTFLACQENTISTLDVSALTSLTYLNCRVNTISTLDLELLTALVNVNCKDNGMAEGEVDNILCDLDGTGAIEGELDISGSNAAPTATGLTCKGNLETDDWDVMVTT